MARQCVEPRADGSPCQMAPLADSDRCWAHDPRHAAERQAARRQGGKTRQKRAGAGAAEPVELRTVADVRALVEQAAGDTLALESSIARSRCLAYLATVGAELLKTSDFEERLAALEARQAAGGRRHA